MMREKVYKILILLLLIMGMISIYLYITNRLVAVICLVGLLLVFWCYNIFNNAHKRKKEKSFLTDNRKFEAIINSVEVYGRNDVILQLIVKHPETDYITSLIIHDPGSDEMNQYKQGNIIKVYIDPKDKHHIVFPQSSQHRKHKKSRLEKILWNSIFFLPGALPLALSFFSTGDKIFQDIAYISVNDSLQTIWELRYSAPERLYINVYDPVKNKRIKSINFTNSKLKR